MARFLVYGAFQERLDVKRKVWNHLETVDADPSRLPAWFWATCFTGVFTLDARACNISAEHGCQWNPLAAIEFLRLLGCSRLVQRRFIEVDESSTLLHDFVV